MDELPKTISGKVKRAVLRLREIEKEHAMKDRG
jgi:acyl-coenzyme A synthetase/AMP-(fatty) acid ligase